VLVLVQARTPVDCGHCSCNTVILLQWPQSKRFLAWPSANTLDSINVVALRRARLVLGWVTICWQANYLSVLPANQVALLLP